MSVLLSPPLAFLIYLPLVFAIYFVGKGLAGKEKPSPEKSSLYGSGEEAATSMASPGYRPFFLIAFFFALLHLGMLVMGTGQIEVKLLPYIIGLILALVALILG
jgi:NADH:ubiquinone oxidoreductase subunit 3 (subunit A)